MLLNLIFSCCLSAKVSGGFNSTRSGLREDMDLSLYLFYLFFANINYVYESVLFLFVFFVFFKV